MMENNNRPDKKLLALLKINQTASKYYYYLSAELTDSRASNCYLLYGEQKENFVNQLILELDKLNIPIPSTRSLFIKEKKEEINFKICSHQSLSKSTKLRELDTIDLYNEIIVEVNLPDSIVLTLMRQRDQIGLALRYLDKIAA